MPLKNYLYHAAWLFYFCSLPLFKAFASVAEVTLLIFTVALGSFFSLKHTIFRYKWVTALALIFFPLLWAMLYTEDLPNGWRILKHQHRFLVIPLLFLANAVILREHFRKYLLAYIGATTLACAFIILLYLLPETIVRNLANSTKLMLPYPQNIDRTAFGLYSPFIDRIQFSSLTAVAILSSIYLFMANSFRRLLFIAFPILFFTMLILGGRGAQLALFISLLVYATGLSIRFIAPKFKARWGKFGSIIFLTLVGCCLFIGVPYISYKTIKPIQNRIAQTEWEIDLLQKGTYTNYDYVHFTTFRRIVSVKNMWEVVKQNPVLGVGTGDYHKEIQSVYKLNNPEMEVNTHNQYLLFWAMAGIFGVLLFLAVSGYWLYSIRNTGTLYFFGLAFLVFYLVNMVPDSVLFTQVDSMLFCTFMALIGLQKPPSEGNAYA